MFCSNVCSMKWPLRRNTTVKIGRVNNGIDRQSTLSCVDYRTDFQQKGCIHFTSTIECSGNSLNYFQNKKYIEVAKWLIRKISRWATLTTFQPVIHWQSQLNRTLLWALSAARYQFHVQNGLKEVVASHFDQSTTSWNILSFFSFLN